MWLRGIVYSGAGGEDREERLCAWIIDSEQGEVLGHGAVHRCHAGAVPESVEGRHVGESYEPFGVGAYLLVVEVGDKMHASVAAACA